MSDFGDALGTAMEGGLYAKAVDGEAKGQTSLSDGHFAEGTCLNCGTELVGSHCHSCGQAAHLHRTIGAFIHDLLHGALHFEGRTWKTLPMLFFKPGELTRRYIDGERARYVSPMALFLFSIFLMFAVFQIAGLSAPTDIGGSVTSGQLVDELDDTRNDLRNKREQLLEESASTTDESEKGELKAELEAIDEDLEALEGGRRILLGDDQGKSSDGYTITGETDWPILQKLNEKWRKNPSLMLYKLQANFYKFSWLLIPISIPFVWLLFAWRRKFRAYDHAIFVTYSIAFMSILMIMIPILMMVHIPAWLLGILLFFVPPIHLYKQLRGTYGLSRFSAFWRLGALTVFITIILALFLQLLLVIGAF